MLLEIAALFEQCVISYIGNSDSLFGVSVVANASYYNECMRVVTTSGFASFDGNDLLFVRQKLNIHNEN